MRARLAAIVESSDDAIVSKDLHGVITSWNQGAERLFGYTAEEAIGQPVTLLIPPDRLDEEPRILERLRRAERIDHFETVRRRKDGSLLDVSLSVSPIVDSQGQVVGASKIARDITQRKNTELALARAREELADRAGQLEEAVAERTAKLRETIAELEGFSYSIAHDMRAPLRAMQGFSDILLEEYSQKLDPPGQAYLRRIATAASRMDHLIVDILNYSKVVRGELPLEPVDLNSLLEGLLESYPIFFKSGADIQVDGRLPKVLGNVAALTQVFSNLLANAIKFVGPGIQPVVRLWAEPACASPDSTDSSNRESVKDHAMRVRIFVRDNGIGIAPDQHDKIFAIFQRLNHNTAGTGIGLSIAKKAAERMAGQVGVDSAPGQGSTFWIELPAA